MRLEALVRTFLIGTHQARISHHIGGEDRGETAGGGRSGHGSGGANSRAQFNLFLARKRHIHAAEAPMFGSAGSAVVAIAEITETGSLGHSSGTPALRNPAK